MEKRLFVVASILLFFAIVLISAEVEDVDDLTRQERGFLFKVNKSWYAAYKNFTATKLINSNKLFTSLLNSSSLPFKNKKIGLLNSLTNVKVGIIKPNVNSTSYKLVNKFSTKLKNSTLSFVNTTSTFINSLLNAKLTLKNSTYLAKLQFLNASGIALQTALNAKANKTNTKLIYLLNSTDPFGWKVKKNLSLLWADEFGEIYNLTSLQSELLWAKLNKTHFRDDVEMYDYNNDIEYEDVYNTNTGDGNEYQYQTGTGFENEAENGDHYTVDLNSQIGNGDQFQVEYEFEYE